MINYIRITYIIIDNISSHTNSYQKVANSRISCFDFHFIIHFCSLLIGYLRHYDNWKVFTYLEIIVWQMLDSAVTKIKSIHHLRLVSCHRIYCVFVTLLEILQIGNFPLIYLLFDKYSWHKIKIRCKKLFLFWLKKSVFIVNSNKYNSFEYFSH